MCCAVIVVSPGSPKRSVWNRKHEPSIVTPRALIVNQRELNSTSPPAQTNLTPGAATGPLSLMRVASAPGSVAGYVPGSTSTTSPAVDRWNARSNVAHGRDWTPRAHVASFPVGESQVVLVAAGFAPAPAHPITDATATKAARNPARRTGGSVPQHADGRARWGGATPRPEPSAPRPARP